MQRSFVVSVCWMLAALAGVAVVVGFVWLDAGEARAQGGATALHDGWSNVAYQGEVLPVDQALTEALDVVISVWHWEGADQSWLAWFAGSPVASSLVVLEPGQAYWIRASAERSWTPRTAVLFEAAQVEIETASTSLSLEIELADTPTKRSRGLMFRQQLGSGAGMLFIFPGDTSSGFWMQNTFVPLSIAFIDSDGVIVNIQDMEPLSTAVHSPGASYRWALEVNQGWFGANGVVVGDVVSLVGA